MAEKLDLSFDVEEGPVPKLARGRGVSKENQQIAEVLKQQLKDRKARSFKNITDDNREEYARKVRAAAKIAGMEGQVTTVRQGDKLFWGPTEVIKELQNATPTPTKATASKK